MRIAKIIPKWWFMQSEQTQVYPNVIQTPASTILILPAQRVPIAGPHIGAIPVRGGNLWAGARSATFVSKASSFGFKHHGLFGSFWAKSPQVQCRPELRTLAEDRIRVRARWSEAVICCGGLSRSPRLENLRMSDAVKRPNLKKDKNMEKLWGTVVFACMCFMNYKPSCFFNHLSSPFWEIFTVCWCATRKYTPKFDSPMMRENY